MPSGFLALAERLSGRQTSSVCVNGMLVDMERVKMPLPDGPPPQTPLTKRAKLSGQILLKWRGSSRGSSQSPSWVLSQCLTPQICTNH